MLALSGVASISESKAANLQFFATCTDSAGVSVWPEVPHAGSAFEVRVRGVAPSAVLISVAGTALVGRVDSTGTGAVFLAPAPIDSAEGIELRVDCADSSGSVTRRVETRVGSYKMERLKVAPAFGTSPNKALAARMAKEANLAAEVSAQSLRTPQLWNATFAAPRKARITSGFGNGRTFNGNVVSRHMGTDYAGAIGSAVLASNRGVVRLVDAFYLGGNVVYIDHGAGVVSVYLHLSRQLVTVGDTVNRGTTIGRVGATGRVTGPHLHFITRIAGTTVDPASIIGRR